MVERDGKARLPHIERVNAKTLKAEIRENVAPTATIITDEWASYREIGTEFVGGHHTVIYSHKEYARKDESGLSINTNSAESYFALLKRGHYGVYHQLTCIGIASNSISG